MSAARPARRLPVPGPILALILLVVGIGVYGAIAPEARASHPEPRAGVTAERVQPPEQFADVPEIAAVYREVARLPHVMDGIYCHCRCSEHSGHYSLLSCFESDHGARCDICLGAAKLAATMSREGASLDEIRRAVDEQLG